MIKNTITGLKYKVIGIFEGSFNDEDNDDDSTLYGWYDAILEGN